MQILKAAVLYFALTFGAGFVLGSTRVLWLVSRVGERAAELMELPIMLAVTVLAARWVVGRLAVPAAPGLRLAVGWSRWASCWPPSSRSSCGCGA